MKYVKILLTAALIFTAGTAFSKKTGDKKENIKPVYVFGVSASFADTIVYYTDIHVLDSVSLDNNGFLPNRELYSYQLKNYIESSRKQENRTCMIYFSENKKKLDKEFAKLMAKYKKSGGVALEAIPLEQFRFNRSEISE